MGKLLHLVLPRSETEFNARNVTVTLVELIQMRNLPKDTDWFVVGAGEAGSQTHVTTVGDKRIDEQHAIITGAIDRESTPSVAYMTLGSRSLARVWSGPAGLTRALSVATSPRTA